jgi:predicted kinase
MAALAIDVYDAPARERIEQLQWQLAQSVLVLGTTVIVEWGTWARSERDALRERARELGAAVELRFLDAPLEVLWARIRDRDMEGRLGHRAFTRADLEESTKFIERPDAEELALFDPPSASP